MLKKLYVIFMTIMAIIIISGCSSKDSANVKKEGEESQLSGPSEPANKTVCAFCNMEVYQKDHEMGVFTGQAVTKEGETLFFDDSGCILNYERKAEEKLAKRWVRDYVTSEWIEADAATPVQSAVKTPMKYGYSFFKDEVDAKAFIHENPNLNPALTNWESIDDVANNRYQKKMKMQKEQNSNQ